MNQTEETFNCLNLNTPADADLSRRASVLLSHLDYSGVAQCLTLGQGTVALEGDPLPTTVLHQLSGLLEGMVLHLMAHDKGS